MASKSGPCSGAGGMRVGILFEYGSLNGGEFSMLAAIDHLQRSDVVPFAICPEPSPLAEALRGRGICCLGMEFPAAAQPQSHDDWANRLNQVIQEHELQLLHANSLTMSRRLGTIAPRLRCPTTGHVRDIMTVSAQAVRSLNAHRKLAAVSNATRLALVQQGVIPDKVETLYNGIDQTRFFPREKTGALRRELGIPVDAPVAATIGQICLRKGQNDLAAAAVMLKDEFPNLHYLLIGQRHSTKQESIAYDDGISETFRQAGLSDRLHRLDFRNDIAEILRDVDLLIHPARQEPLGRVLLEAAACAVPIVATRVGGTEEILTHARTAWLVPAADPARLAEGIRSMLADSQFARQCGNFAAEEISTRFSAELAARNHLRFWQQAALT